MIVTAGVTTGNTFKFKIAATNIAGTSIFTSEIAILAATVPDPPTGLIRDDANTNLS